MESLSDKLKSMGLVPAKKIQPPKTALPSLEEIIPGIEIQNSLGTCYLSRTDYLNGYRHGKVEFSNTISTSEISAVTRNINQDGINPEGLFFLDTETTGLAGGTGTFAFLVGIGYQYQDGFRVDQYLLRDPGEEAAMLLELANFFEHSSIISTYNGKSFDVPLLNARYTMNRLSPPFENLNHLDLLHLSRRLWRNRLESRTLQDLEREILNIPRDENEVPGWMIPEIYFDYQRTGDPTPLAGVLYHNRMDILSLAALMIYIGDAMKQISLDQYSLHLTDIYSMGVIYDDVGMHQEAEKLFLRCLEDNHLESSFQMEIYSRLAHQYKQQARWTDAVKMWQKGVALQDLDSTIELAKYYEHQKGDFSSAQVWANQAKILIDKLMMPRYKKKKMLEEIAVRQQRLSKLILKREERRRDEQQNER